MLKIALLSSKVLNSLLFYILFLIFNLTFMLGLHYCHRAAVPVCSLCQSVYIGRHINCAPQTCVCCCASRQCEHYCHFRTAPQGDTDCSNVHSCGTYNKIVNKEQTPQKESKQTFAALIEK